MSEKKLRFETLQIHGGYAPDHTLSRGLAIYPTAAYHFKTCDYAANLFELSEAGNIYTRIHNPTTANYENRVAALYGGVGALATSSGMSAILLTVTALAKAGDNIVTSPYVYGGTHNQFSISLRNLGVEVRFAKNASAEAIEELIDGFLPHGLSQVICTDITKDGMLQGPSDELYVGLQDHYPSVDFTVSGGIGSMADIERLNEKQLRKVIVGKAIYENRITLKDIEQWSLNV